MERALERTFSCIAVGGEVSYAGATTLCGLSCAKGRGMKAERQRGCENHVLESSRRGGLGSFFPSLDRPSATKSTRSHFEALKRSRQRHPMISQQGGFQIYDCCPVEEDLRDRL